MKTVQADNVSIEEVKNTILQNKGNKISIKEFNKQGKLLKKTEGVIIDVYNNVFLVKINVKCNFFNKSFSYVDFLTKELIFEILE